MTVKTLRKSVLKEVWDANYKEISLCHFHLHHHYHYAQETEKFWKLCFARKHWPSVWYSGPELFFAVLMTCHIERLNASSKLQWTLSYAGENGTSRKVLTACKITLGPADRRFFPPQQQHKIVALATQPPRQEGHPITHWSISDLSRAVMQKGIVNSIACSTIWRLLDQAAIKPHRWHYWLNSPDPEFEVKMLDIVNLYLQAFQLLRYGEIILSVDEKTSIQALKRKYPHKPIIPGSGELIEHEYKRHGTCCLTAGLEVATGQIMGMLTPNRPAEVFAEFIQWVLDFYADAKKIHIVADNLNTHYHELTCQVVAQACDCELPETKTGRQRKEFLTDPSKRVVFHFTPSHASWLNQIEIWFSVLTRKVIRRGDFSSVDELEDKIIEFIEYYDRYLAKPYQWTYTGKPLAAHKKGA